ncbi:CPBP family intramembrane glutamic endopeptidase [Pedobacter punctiformis]|uniref:Type II CAAX endopeptidase family protein n=1 Tax=Pedobacter punctiformis TaxID=3004097 RepID=A0ABT4L7M9_9SPHI|nr:type II CAAX endopeptidase family protein [Pedobacter sp. HCMS5-2]MCZ4243930.1 type II CAAX endopeptidase family protein [Pedobacter sp. HCMS5-2]
MENKFLYYLKPILSVFLFAFLILIWGIPFGMLDQMKVFNFPEGSFSSNLYNEVSLIIMAVGALLMIFKIFPSRNFEGVFIVNTNILSGFFKGTLIGLGLIACCTAIIYANGNVVFSKSEINPVSILAYLLFFVLVGISEEFVFRSFPLVVFSERYLISIAVVINGLLFGLIHLTNPNFSIVPMINITLSGILFSIITLQKRNIWWAVGLHFGWNFCQGTLLGFKVSGLDAPGLMVAKPIGSPLFSGGLFGAEGSLLCTVILLIYIVWLLIKGKIQPVQEIFNDDEFIGER